MQSEKIVTKLCRILAVLKTVVVCAEFPFFIIYSINSLKCIVTFWQTVLALMNLVYIYAVLDFTDNKTGNQLLH